MTDTSEPLPFRKLVLYKIALALPFIFSAILIADYCLPSVILQQKVTDFEWYYTGGGKSRRGTTVRIVKSGHYATTVADEIYFKAEKGDPVVLRVTPILKLTTEFNLIKVNERLRYYCQPEYSVYNGFLIFPFSLFIASLLGLLAKQEVWMMRFGLVNFILLGAIFWIIYL